MNSINRFTKRVKSTVLALVLDVRGEHLATSPALLICGAGAIVAAGVGVTHQLGQAKANLDTTASGGDALNGKLTTMVSGTPEATPAAVDPTK